MYRWLTSFLCAFSVIAFSAPSDSKAQDYAYLFQYFSTEGLTFAERRYLQAALAFEGHYVGLLDGDWGRLSREAMHRYSYKEFGTPSEEWHTALLALSFFERIETDGWEMQYFPVLGMSVLLPAKNLVVDPPTEHLLNFRHSRSSLAISLGRHSQDTANSIHQYTLDSHAQKDVPYSVRKSNFAVSTATMRDGAKLYTRSDFIDGGWSTVIVSTASADPNLFQAVTSSIAVGEALPLGMTTGGKLMEVVRSTVAFADTGQVGKEPPRPSDTSAAEPVVESSGSGFIVSDQGHILTNAHVVENCSEIFADGRRASLVDASSDFDLALLKAAGLDEKSVAVFSARPAQLNSDVTAVGFPYAGLLGGLNVTRGAVSALKGLGGDVNRFQITAPIQSGNSGGPVLSSNGEVIGVVVSKLNATKMAENVGDVPQNVNFAVRGEIAKLFLAQNQVEPKLNVQANMSPEGLARVAAQFTLFIECL